ncbi:MAG TPA: adenylate kinase [Elusimicrobia bacterium]|jgi:adenylate kinase|nr:adenylate kinase [Elusimicrobiota bacterium]
MNLVLLGLPGVGKGTQAKLLATEYDLVHISTGDLLREAVNKGTPLGKQAKEIMVRGELVPDVLVFSLLKERLKLSNPNGFVLDGFPRNVYQARILEEYLEEINKKINCVIYFEVSEEEIVRRLSARRICARCQANYNLITKPPKKEGICDICGEKIIYRSDDHPETIKERLKVYQKETVPVIEYYQQQGILKKINGKGQINQIYNLLKNTLQSCKDGASVDSASS